MTTFQFVLLCVGGIIVLTSFDLTPVWNAVKLAVSKVVNRKQTGVETVLFATSEDPLIEIVKKWDALKDSCEQEGLTEAVAKLNEIFPMLIKVDKDEVKE